MSEAKPAKHAQKSAKTPAKLEKRSTRKADRFMVVGGPVASTEMGPSNLSMYGVHDSHADAVGAAAGMATLHTGDSSEHHVYGVVPFHVVVDTAEWDDDDE